MVVQTIVDGLVVGSIIALGAVGLTLLFGTLNFINVAYGEYMALGAYFTFFLNTQMGLSFWVGLPGGLVLTAVAVAGIEKVFFRPFSEREPIVLLIVSIGVAFILRSVIRIVWTTSVRRYDVPTGEGSVTELFRLFPNQVGILIISVVMMVLIYLLLQRTSIGIAMRAVSNNTNLAQLRGINTDRIVLYVVLIGGGAAGLAGAMLGLDSQLRPLMGFQFLIPVFAAVVLGGIGSPVGAVVSGYLIGVAQELSLLVLPAEYEPVVGLVVLVGVLLVRPEGLFGGDVE
jgi:branched-subunit amino acid ABC-type transport system permease component